MKTLSIDIETYSPESLAKCGVYRYCQAPEFEVLLFGYSVDGGPVQVVDLAAGECIPADVLAALTDTAVSKWAFNAQFERVCLSRYLGYPVGQYLDPDSWYCTMVWSAMESVVCPDDRARGLIQFYGANRTGRFAGRLIQVQNLPQNHLPDLKQARTLVRDGRFDAVELLYDSVPLVLSELIRTAFIPKPGCRFFVADFSAIEARVIAWIAGEQWRQEVFAQGGDIYCASASQMFHVPVVKHGVNGHLRQKGKIAELALGYGGSVGALKAMGALNYGLTEEELKPLVDAWRQSNPRIVKFWWDVDRAAATCVRDKVPAETHGIRFFYQSGMMFIALPSGRKLVYVKPKMGVNRYGSESVTYEGVGEQKKWLRLESYGPKFVENIVQATARDILVEAMRRLEAAGYPIVMHVHDEAVIEAPADTSLDDICAIMGQTPSWAEGLLLRADGYVCDFYQKD